MMAKDGSAVLIGTHSRDEFNKISVLPQNVFDTQREREDSSVLKVSLNVTNLDKSNPFAEWMALVHLIMSGPVMRSRV